MTVIANNTINIPDDAVIIFTISIMLFISPFLSGVLRLPTTIVEIFLGAFAVKVGLIYSHHDIFVLIAEVGFFYLMFLAGTEVNLNILFKLEKKIFIKGSIYLFFIYLISMIFVKALNLPLIFIFMFSLISVGLIMSLFKEYGKDKKWLNLAMHIGVLGELLSIVLLTIVASILEHKGVGEEFFKSILYLTIFLIAIFVFFKVIKVLFWWHPEWKNFLIPNHGDKDEKDIRISMAIFFLMVALMLYINLEIAFGAFIAGVFIATFFEQKKELPHKLETFGFGFLIPIFFIHIGSTFNLSFILKEDFTLKAIGITLIMIFVRVLASTVFYKILKIKDRILFALSHSMPLTLLVAIATLAHKHGTIDDTYYYVLIFASLLEVMISMIAIKVINTYSEDKSGVAS